MWRCDRPTDPCAVWCCVAQDFDPELRLEGVLLNKIGGPAHLTWLEEAITASGVDVRVVGGIPKVATPPVYTNL